MNPALCIGFRARFTFHDRSEALRSETILLLSAPHLHRTGSCPWWPLSGRSIQLSVIALCDADGCSIAAGHLSSFRGYRGDPPPATVLGAPHHWCHDSDFSTLHQRWSTMAIELARSAGATEAVGCCRSAALEQAGNDGVSIGEIWYERPARAPSRSFAPAQAAVHEPATFHPGSSGRCIMRSRWDCRTARPKPGTS